MVSTRSFPPSAGDRRTRHAAANSSCEHSPRAARVRTAFMGRRTVEAADQTGRRTITEAALRLESIEATIFSEDRYMARGKMTQLVRSPHPAYRMIICT